MTSTSSVREIVRRHPGAERVFENHGLAGCGGDDGPDEPVGFFAAIHHVDAAALISELNDFIAATEPVVVQPKPVTAARAAYPLFVVTALVLTLLFGLTTGVAAALSDAYQALPGDAWVALVQAHGHLQLFGFLGLFIMGMAYHIVPRFKAVPTPSRKLILATYGLMLGGVLLRANAQPHGQGWLRVFFGASGPAELAGGVLFALLMANMLFRARERREPSDRFILAACGFLVASLAINAYGVVDAARAGSRVVEVAGDSAALEAAIHGFVLLFVLGVSFRVLPFFLRLRPTHTLLRDTSLAILVAGALARTTGLWAPAYAAASWPADLVHAAALLEAVAILGLVVALRVFEPVMPDAPAGADAPLFGPMVRTAFGWLVVGVALDLAWQGRELAGAVTPYYAAGALRHTVLAGLATTMVVAMAYRTIPVFSGRPLAWPRAVPGVFVLLVAGAALRVFPVVFVQAPSRVDYYLLGFGGAALFAALATVTAQLCAVMFGWWSSQEREGAKVAAERQAPLARAGAGSDGRDFHPAVRADMTVEQALQVHPLVLDLFVERGFAPLANPLMRAAMAQTMTLGKAAGVIGKSPDDLVAEVNAALSGSLAAHPTGGAAPIFLDFRCERPLPSEAIGALRSCYDPEIPVNIVELGLVYGLIVRERQARAIITLTSRGCPAGESVKGEVELALLGLDEIESAEVEIVYEPAWSPARMSRGAKEALGLAPVG